MRGVPPPLRDEEKNPTKKNLISLFPPSFHTKQKQVMLALVGLSIKTKVSTGGGLPAGPGGVVGASEGLNYLALLAALGAFAYSAVAGGN